MPKGCMGVKFNMTKGRAREKHSKQIKTSHFLHTSTPALADLDPSTPRRLL